jgi:nucleotide-binding universal stress UspA family protein
MPRHRFNDVRRRPGIELSPVDGAQGGQRQIYQRVLIALDAGADANDVLRLAGRIALRHGALVTLLHVIRTGGGLIPPECAYERNALRAVFHMEWDSLLSDAARQFLKGLVVECFLADAEDPGEQIVETARSCGADLIVMGAGPYGRFETDGSQLLETQAAASSTTRRVVYSGVCPVMLVDHRGRSRAAVPWPSASSSAPLVRNSVCDLA